MAEHAKSAGKRKAGGLASSTDKKHKNSLNAGSKPVRDANQKAVQKLMAKEAPKENLSKKERKEVSRAHKARKNPEYHKTQEAIALWEKLRRQDTKEAEKKQLAIQILALVKGHVVDLAASPTASRVIQAVAKHGGGPEREALVQEVLPRFLELAKNPYGHFLVSKLLALAPKPKLPGMLKALKGQAPALLRHPSGAAVIDDAFTAASAVQRNSMAAEFYGREFTLFEADAPSSLSELLAKVDPSGRRSIVRNMAIQLIPIMEKGILDPVLSHRLIAEYLIHAPASSVEDAIETLAGPNLLRMVHSRHGAAAAAAVLAYGSPKDRKKTVKAFQGHVKSMARDEWAHLVLMTALDRVDDTALLRKYIIAELLADLRELCEDTHGRRVLLHLLRADGVSKLAPASRQVLQPPPKARGAAPSEAAPPGGPPAEASSTIDAAERDGDEDAAMEGGAQSAFLGASKKDAPLRRRELLGSGQASLAAALCKTCAEHAGVLLRGKAAGDLFVEIVAGGVDSMLQEAAPAELAQLRDAVVSLAARVCGADGDARDDHVLVGFYSSRALCRLVGLSRKSAAAQEFVRQLWSSALEGKCNEWLGTHADKVLAALADCGDAGVAAASRRELSALMKKPLTLATWLAPFKATM